MAPSFLYEWGAAQLTASSEERWASELAAEEVPMGAEGPGLLGEHAAGSGSGRLVPEQLVSLRTLLVLSMVAAQSAERRIISYPQWSDRAIAKVCGLSVKTVGSLRQRMTAELPQLDARVGRDGRARPLKFAEEDVEPVS